MSEANNVHPSEVGLDTPPELSKKEKAKLANILGFFRDAAEAVFPVQGFEVMTDPARNVLLERMTALKPGTLVAQRARLEADSNFRHPIPYILIHRQRPDGSLEFFVYQRTKLIGEDLLGQKFSLALGGHPEIECIRFDADAQFDTEQSLLACLVSELDEEASFNGQSFTQYTEAGGLYTFAHDGFIRDDSDKVGLQHIAIVYAIGLPMDVEVVCLEEELITVGFRTLEELSADLELPEANALYDFENWSKLCIESYVTRIEATRAAEAVDAMFLAEHGHDTPEDVVGRGMQAAVVMMDEEPFVKEYDAEDNQAWRQDQLESAEAAEGKLQEGLVRGADGVLYFTIDADDPDPATTITRLQEVYKETVRTAPEVIGLDTSEASVDQFAKEVIAQVTSVERDGEGVLHVGTEVDPSPETRVLTELHREVGTTDAQMQDAVTELVRISDSVQPEAERELVTRGGLTVSDRGLSDLAS